MALSQVKRSRAANDVEICYNGPMLRISVTIAAAALLSACAQRRERAGSVPAPSASAQAAPSLGRAELGQVVTVVGSAEDAKLGAILLINGSQSIWIDGLSAWPEALRGKPVRVTGKL